MKSIISVLSFASITLSSCQKGDCSNAVKGEFKDLTGLDGCGMVIELSNGEKIEPRNLSDFNVEPEDGKKIWVKYHLAEGGSICMVGDIVRIDCITERK